MASDNEYKVQSFKRFDASDISISSLKTNKGFLFEGGDTLTGSDINVDRFIGTQGNFLLSQSQTGQIPGEEQYSVLVYDSIKQLYYTNYISGSGGEISFANTASFNPDGTITPFSGSDPRYQTSYYNYEETTLNPQKTFNSESIGVISIPNKLYGDIIEPGTFYINSPASGALYDDGDGRLYSTGEDGNGTFYVGNIIYEHGIITITDLPPGETILPTPTPTPSITPTLTPSSTLTPTPSKTPSITPSITPTRSVTPSITPTRSITPTISITPTNSITPTRTITPTRSVTPTITPSITPTITPSRTPGASTTPTPTITPSITPSITLSSSVTPTRTITPSISITPTITISPSITPSVTRTPSITPSITLSPSITPSITLSPSVTPTATPIACFNYTVTNDSADDSTPITFRYKPCGFCYNPDKWIEIELDFSDPGNSDTTTVCACSDTVEWVSGGFAGDGSDLGVVEGSTCITPSPTPTPSPSPSNTPTPTPSLSITPSISITPTITPTKTLTPSITISTSATPSITPTITTTPSITPSRSKTPAASITPTQTPTRSITPSKSLTPTVTPSRTATPTPSPYFFLVGSRTADNNNYSSISAACAGFASTALYANVGNFANITNGTVIYQSSGNGQVFNGQSYWYGIAPSTGSPQKAIQINNVGTVIDIANTCSTPSPTPTPSKTQTPTPTPIPSVTPTVTPSLSPAPSPPACNAIDVGRDAVIATACTEATTSPITLYSNESGLVNGGVYYALSSCTKAFNSSGDYISDGSIYGTTNASGVFTEIGSCP